MVRLVIIQVDVFKELQVCRLQLSVRQQRIEITDDLGHFYSKNLLKRTQPTCFTQQMRKQTLSHLVKLLRPNPSPSSKTCPYATTQGVPHSAREQMGTAVNTTQGPTPPSPQHADQTRTLPPALQPAHSPCAHPPLHALHLKLTAPSQQLHVQTQCAGQHTAAKRCRRLTHAPASRRVACCTHLRCCDNISTATTPQGLS